MDIQLKINGDEKKLHFHKIMIHFYNIYYKNIFYLHSNWEIICFLRNQGSILAPYKILGIWFIVLRGRL